MHFLRRHPIAFFLVAAVAITYVVGMAVYLLLRAVQQQAGVHFAWANDLVLKFGPSLAGVATVALSAGKQGVRDLLRRCVRWRFGVPLYAWAVFLQPAVLVTVLLLTHRGADLRTVAPGPAAGTFGLQLFSNVFLGGGLGEELGWRGFLLPQLCRRHSPLVASLLVGLAWFAWHIPAYAFLNKGAEDPLLPFALISLPFSVLLTWAYFRSNGSLLLPILLHGSINAAYYTLAAALPALASSAGFQPGFDWALAAIWYLLAGLVVLRWGSELARRQP
jgi:uncharacterized protein